MKRLAIAALSVIAIALAAPGSIRAQDYGSPVITCDPHIAEVTGAKLVPCTSSGPVWTGKEVAKPRVSVKLIDDNTGKRVTFNLPVPHPTVDRAFVTWNVISQATTIADGELSVRRGRETGVYETNPIYGSPVTRGRYYAVSELIYGLTSWASYRSKRESDAARYFGARPDFTHRMWWLPQFGNAAAHLIGIGFTIARTGR